MVHDTTLRGLSAHPTSLRIILQILLLIALMLIVSGVNRALAAPLDVLPDDSPAIMANLAFEDMTPEEWRALRRQVVHGLRSGDEDVRVQSLQSIIFLSMYYSDRVSFAAAAPRLFDIFVSSPSEKMRIMAVAALHNVGEPQSMAHLQHVWRLDRSERVRQLALSALVNYYRQPEITIGPVSRQQ